MSEVIQLAAQPISPQSEWWELLYDAKEKIENKEELNAEPTFEFKWVFQRMNMTAAELSQYMIDQRAYFADKARYAQEHTWVLQYVGQTAANDNVAPKLRAAQV